MISIVKDLGNFYFKDSRGFYDWMSLGSCHYCGRSLVKSYVEIIDSLKNRGLIDDSYKLICCFCKKLINLAKMADKFFLRRNELIFLTDGEEPIIYDAFHRKRISIRKKYSKARKAGETQIKEFLHDFYDS